MSYQEVSEQFGGAENTAVAALRAQPTRVTLDADEMRRNTLRYQSDHQSSAVRQQRAGRRRGGRA